MQERAFCVAGLTVWNSLRESLRSADSISSFKRQLKAHFLIHISTVYSLYFCVLCFHTHFHTAILAQLDVGLALILPSLITDRCTVTNTAGSWIFWIY